MSDQSYTEYSRKSFICSLYKSSNPSFSLLGIFHFYTISYNSICHLHSCILLVNHRYLMSNISKGLFHFSQLLSP